MRKTKKLYGLRGRSGSPWHKKALAMVGAVLAVGVFVLLATSVKADIETGLVGKWKLDEATGTTTADISGNGNDGTIVQTGSSPAWVTPGHDGTGAALDFDGAGAQGTAANSVNLGNSALMDQMDNYTISVWAKFEPGYVGGGGGFANLVGRNSSGANWAWMLYVQNNGTVRPHHKNSNGSFVLQDSATVIPTGEWVHIEQVASDGLLHLYINGVEDPNFPIAYSGTTFSLPSANVWIGQDARERAPLATISEVSIYNKARTAPGGVTGNLQLWMRGDSGVTGSSPVSSWTDFSGEGNNGTATGNPELSNGSVNFNDTISLDGTSDGFDTNLSIDPALFPNLAVFSVYKPGANPAGAVWGSDDGSSDRSYGQTGTCAGTTNGTGCVNVPGSFAPNEWKLSATVFDEDAANGSSAYVNGLLKSTFTANHGPETNAPFKIGQAGSNNDYFNGDIAEVVVYDHLLDTGSGRQRVESYLATRYGITLGDTGAPVNYIDTGGNTFWTGSATYQNDVAGIGRDDRSPLDQKQSKSVNSDALVTIGLGAIAADNDSNSNGFANDLTFMMWGNNNGSTDVANNPVPVSGTALKSMERIWSVQETGTIGTVQLRIPKSTLMGTPPTLLVSSDETFDNTDQQIALSENGGNYEADVNFSNGQFFTLALGALLPQVTTTSDSNISETAATLNGTLDTLGDFSPVTAFFRYRIQGSGDPFTETASQQLTASGAFSQGLVGLDSSTTYEYKAVIQWEDGSTQEAEGDLVTFITFAEDGTPACIENYVDCFTNPVTGTNVKLVVDDACTINTAEMKPETDMSVADPDGFEYPLGLMDFTVDCGTPGYTTTVTQYYYDTTDDTYILRKHNPNTSAYFTIDDATITQTTLNSQAAVVATYQITDGGNRDVDGVADGTIIDPAGLAVTPDVNGGAGTPNTGLLAKNMLIPAGFIVAGAALVFSQTKHVRHIRQKLARK